MSAPFGRERDLDETSRLVGAWLSGRLENSSGIEVFGLHYPDGAGISNETVLFEAAWQDPAGSHRRELVLRIHPSSFQLFMEPHFEQQFEVLALLGRELLVRVPDVLWFEPDPSILGQPFFVMECLRGRVPVTSPVYNRSGWLADAAPKERRQLWVNAMTELSRIHTVPVDLVQILDQPQLGPDGLTQELEYSMRSLDWSTGGAPPAYLLEVWEWLEKTLPSDRYDGLAWGDARIGNMVFGDAFEVVGVLDWEQASLGSGREDLGWWLLFDDLHCSEPGVDRLDGLGARRETIDLWEELTGATAGSLDWYEAFAAFKLLQIACRARQLLGAPLRGPEGEQWLVRRTSDITGIAAPPKHLVSD